MEQLYKFEPSKYEVLADDGQPKYPLQQFEGHIMLRPPEFDECMEYLEQSGVDLVEEEEKDKKKKESKDDKIEVAKKNMKQLRAMVRISAPHYKEVKLKNRETQTEYKSFHDLSVDPECRNLLAVVGGMVVRGFGPSKH